MKLDQYILTKKGCSTIRGFLLVEMVLASALFILAISAFLGGYLYGEKTIAESGNAVQASLLAEAGLEAVRNIRNEDFKDIEDGQYGLNLVNGKWTFASTSDTTGIFIRSITVAPSGTDRKTITSQVSWFDMSNATKTVSLSRFFTNWLDLRYWYWPGLKSTLSLPNGGDKVQVVGNYAYVTGALAPSFYIVNVTSSTSPSLTSTFTLVGTLQNLYVSGNYAYVVSDDNNKELQVVNITNKAAPSLAGSYNAPGNGDAKGIYVLGNYAYMTRQNGAQDEFIILNISNPSSPSLVGSLDLGATAFEAFATGTLAYVASDNNTEELQIVDISNPSAPYKVGVLNLSLKEQNRSSSITLRKNILYLGQGKDLYVINVATTSAPVIKSNVSVADYFNDVAIDLGNKGRYLFVATSDVGKEFKLYEVSSSTNPYVYGTSLNLTGDNPLYGITYEPTTNMVYAVSHSTGESFFVIAP